MFPTIQYTGFFPTFVKPYKKFEITALANTTGVKINSLDFYINRQRACIFHYRIHITRKTLPVGLLCRRIYVWRNLLSPATFEKRNCCCCLWTFSCQAYHIPWTNICVKQITAITLTKYMKYTRFVYIA